MSEPLDARDAVDLIRARPGMYTGDTRDGTGAVELVMALVGNAFDQHLAGRCTRIDVQVGDDGIVVRDDGPGMAGDDTAILARFARWTDLPTEDGHRPHVHLSFGPLSLVVACALSTSLELHSVRNGIELRARWARGRVVDAPHRRPTTAASGTEVRLVLDPDIFGARLDRGVLLRRLEDLTLLAPGIAVTYAISGALPRGGLAAHVARAAWVASDAVVTAHAEHPTEFGPITIDLALAWRAAAHAYPPVIDSFVNYIRSRDHGAHVDGLLDGITRVIRGRRAERARGLVAAVSVVLADVHFGNPTRDRLVTPDARPAVAAATAAALRAAITRGVSVPSAAGARSPSPSPRRRR